ncbi:MAG: DsbA family protein [Leucobacter sp.]
MSNESSSRPTKNERRAEAREQARVAREAEKKREKRNRLYIQGGVVLGVVAVLAIVGLVLTQSLKPAGPGPMNMASGGAIFAEDLKVVPGDRLEDPAAQRIAPEVDRESVPLDVSVYVDYMCSACGSFEQQNGTMLENYVGSGDITLRVYPINFLDGQSLGTKYSTRAANIFACVVEQQPDAAFALHTRLLSAEVQPAEGTTGLDDKQLIQEAVAAGAEADSELQSCVRDRSFAGFIDENNTWAMSDLVGLAEGEQLVAATDNQGNPIELQDADGPQRLVSTPLVLVNGKQWNGARDGALESYILKIKGEIEQASAGADDAPADDSTTEEKTS